MPRAKRYLEPGAIFHVMNRGSAKKNVFLDSADRNYFLSLLKELRRELYLKTFAYVLMGNHYHLLLKDDKMKLSEGMKSLSLAYTRWFNRKYKLDGPLFRGRFHSKRIEFESQLIATIDYIHLNPVKDGFVQKASEWQWSSIHYYLAAKPWPSWLEDARACGLVDGQFLSEVYT